MRNLISIVLAACAVMCLAPAEAGVFADVGPFQSAAKVRKRIDETAGLMLQADLSGTKYWKSKKLNPQ